jgi:RNA polymerase sigma factor (sigma-70 family)
MIGQRALEACGGADFAWLQATRGLSASIPRDAGPMSTAVLWGGDTATTGARATRSSAWTTDALTNLRPRPRNRASHDAANRNAARASTGARRFEELMQAAQEGDGRAYGQLLREVTPVLRGAVRRRRSFLGAADIEDLVQETLLSVHVARATYDPLRPFLPWLYAILERRMADLGRQHARRSTHEVQDDDAALSATADQAETGVDGYGDRRRLAQAIGELPRRQRTAVELLKLRQMSLKEASAASGMSSVALRVLVHRALISLRKKLDAAALEVMP